MQLSPHFTMAELTVSETAARLGLDNTPGQAEVANLKRLAKTLEQIRTLVGGPVVVTSGYRSLAVNRAIGSGDGSAHVKGLAADINRPGITPKTLAARIAASDIEYDQLILEFDSWVHVGLSLGKPRRQNLTIRQGTGYMTGIC